MAEFHVAVMTFPSCSHPMCMFGITRAMASLAPSSHFSFFSTKHSLSLLKSPQLPTNISLVEISDGITPPRKPTAFEELELFLKSYKYSIREALKTAEHAQGSKVRYMVVDSWVWLAADVADEMAVKWVPVVTASPHDLYARLNVSLIKNVAGFGDEDKRFCDDNQLNFLPGHSNHCRVVQRWNGELKGDTKSIIPMILDQSVRRLSYSDTLIVNGIEDFDPALDSSFKQKFTRYFPVGPFNLLNESQNEPPTDSFGCLSWLDGHEPGTVAYISIGTVAFLGPSELASLANGLEDSGVPFLWSLKEEMQALLPSGFLQRVNGNGKIVSWAPQVSVLKHSAIGVFVSHCGWNSIMESIVAGVPVICRPFSGDQILNTSSVSNVWKIGVALEEDCFTEKGIVKALDEILKSEEGKNMRKNVHELKDIVTAAIAENGSSRANVKRLLKFVCAS